MSWYEFDEYAVADCRDCNWRGRAVDGDLEVSGFTFGWSCPRCEKTLAVFAHVAEHETQLKAAEGNPKALKELEEREARRRRRGRSNRCRG